MLIVYYIFFGTGTLEHLDHEVSSHFYVQWDNLIMTQIHIIATSDIYHFVI